MNENWIDVKERLPPQDNPVLVSIYDGRDKVKMSHVEILVRFNNNWVSPVDYSNYNYKYGVVTHWMCLPDPYEIFLKVKN